MARIVSYAHRYKRPPKKRKAVALEVPAIVTTKRSRRPVPGSAAAEAVSHSPRRDDGATQPCTARSGMTTPPPARESAIVTAKRSKRIAAAPDADKETSPSVKAFFARMLRPPGQ
jgi:hypothetical protein